MTEAIAPGYLKIIQTPMDLSTILKKVKRDETINTSIWCGVDVSWMFAPGCLIAWSCGDYVVMLTRWKLYGGDFLGCVDGSSDRDSDEPCGPTSMAPSWLKRVPKPRWYCETIDFPVDASCLVGKTDQGRELHELRGFRSRSTAHVGEL